MSLLKNYGWDYFPFKDQYNSPDAQPGRVIAIKGFKHHLITGNGELECELSGKLLYGTDPEDLPRVGDWVQYLPYGDAGLITQVFPRVNALSRKKPGNKTEKQILASNIDYALIVQGLDGNFNIMRLERYVVQILACGITPVIVLNKADLITDRLLYEEQVARLHRDIPVFFCSTITGAGIAALRESLMAHKTYILVGSSGVGKSSLLNLLLDAEVQQTAKVSDATQKGRHTTTTRDLFPLPSGSLMIDTPGMREFGMTHEEGQDSEVLFPAIMEFASRCRYADCLHLDEPGCAVLEGLASGKVSREVYESYLKLMKEQKRFQVNAEDRKRMNKQFGRMAREAQAYRRKYKF